MSEVGFGRLALALRAPEDLLALEEQHDVRFEAWDARVGQLVTRAIRGERTVNVARKARSDTLSIDGLDKTGQAWLEESFDPELQQTRGAWYLPEDVSLRVGVVNLAWHLSIHARFAMTGASDERARVKLEGSPAAVCTWAVLEPLFSELFLPFEMRAAPKAAKSRDEEIARWDGASAFADALGFRVEGALSRMRYGSGWSKLTAGERLELKTELMHVLASQVTEATAARYRSLRVLDLVRRYYAKAHDGRAKRRDVLSRGLQRVLSGIFAGDWLAFLDYLGEKPHPDEEVITALPVTRVYVGGADRAETVAAEQGLPVDEVKRMLATYWDETSSASPVERRVELLKRYWSDFDAAHARQATGMRPLWGLVEEGGFIEFTDDARTPYQSGIYREVLPADLLAEIDALWGSVMLPRWPERIVTEPWPHRQLAEAFGPALRFWHGCALTAWFLCEGPYSRTDMAGLAHYHSRELEALSAAGCPIAESLFRELVAAERALGPPEPITADSSTRDVGRGITLSIEMHIGSRRGGFSSLRDIITSHRRAWSSDHLDAYLRTRWEGEVREAAAAHARAMADRGKPPTPKQFARHAEAAVNHWFGGNLALLYGAIGEKAPLKTERIRLLPANAAAFAWNVFVALGGRTFEKQVVVSNRVEGQAQAVEQQRHHNLKRLAQESLRYVQLEEALERPPEMSEFGTGKFQLPSQSLDPDVSIAWTKYVEAIEAARSRPTPSTELHERPDMPTSSTAGDSPSKRSAAGAPPEARRSLFDRLRKRRS